MKPKVEVLKLVDGAFSIRLDGKEIHLVTVRMLQMRDTKILEDTCNAVIRVRHTEWALGVFRSIRSMRSHRKGLLKR